MTKKTLIERITSPIVASAMLLALIPPISQKGINSYVAKNYGPTTQACVAQNRQELTEQDITFLGSNMPLSAEQFDTYHMGKTYH